MGVIKKIFNKLNDRKAVTGTDIAAAITVIVLTIGIVTSIYVNAINKSKDNLRYANAVRIATNIMENIQANSYEILITTCKETGNTKSASSGKIFGTKIPNGFQATVTANPGSGEVDIARDVTVTVKYKASTTYKTISLTSVKEKELMDMTNAPDFSLIPGYGTSGQYFYPVKSTDKTNFKITTMADIDWFDYEEGKYALVYKTTSGNLNVEDTTTDKANIYAWIPRYVQSSTAGINGVKFLYGASKYTISFNSYTLNGKVLYSYGLANPPVLYTAISGFSYSANSFKDNDGLSGSWYRIDNNGTNDTTDKRATIAKNAFTALNTKLPKVNF